MLKAICRNALKRTRNTHVKSQFCSSNCMNLTPALLCARASTTRSLRSSFIGILPKYFCLSLRYYRIMHDKNLLNFLKGLSINIIKRLEQMNTPFACHLQ